MEVLGDLIDRDRRSSTTALRAPAVGRSYDYRRFCTNAWKVGNFLRHLGVRSGAVVTVADEPLPEPVLTLFGASLLGGVVRFGPDEGVDDARALVIPAREVDDYAVGASTKRVVYGDAPDDPGVSYFERDVWSENPTMPPDRVEPDDPLLSTPGRNYTHDELLSAAERTVAELGIAADDDVAVREAFADPGVVAAGLFAPLVAGSTTVVGPDSNGDYVVGGDESDVDVESILG